MKKLGDILRDQRERQGLTLEQAEESTKIRKSYLRNLEDGDYALFPAPSAIKGFLKIYADYLGLQEKEVMAFFRREFDESKDGSISTRSVLKPVREPLIRFTPQSVFTVICVSAIAILFAYIWVQYQAFAGAPLLEIYSPKDGVVTQKAELDIEGKVSANSNLSLNNQKVDLGRDGYFKTNIQLSEGVNVLTFVAVSEVGKSTTEKRTVRLDVVR
jgi:cytoskeletal protein RodZ